MLSRKWSEHKNFYDFVVVGSGYGGAITAARIATSDVAPKPAICILEREKVADQEFPGPVRNLYQRNPARRPSAAFELLNYRDISVIKGSGGRRSLVNANVAIVPDAETFQQDGCPRASPRHAEPSTGRAQDAVPTRVWPSCQSEGAPARAAGAACQWSRWTSPLISTSTATRMAWREAMHRLRRLCDRV
jgi:choline dehydrogenase-like flavoprotein